MKKIITVLCAAVLTASMFAGCQPSPSPTPEPLPDPTIAPLPDPTQAPEAVTLNVAVFEGGYGADMWREVATAFEAKVPNVKVELNINKNLEDAIGPAMKAGDYPDAVYLAVGRPAALTETMIKENALADITDMLSMTVPGESVTVKDKMLAGFTDTLVTNPYNDGKTYLAPMFYSPNGLFYNKALFESKGWTVPNTWDEMWALGDKAKEEGIALFTYPTSGYFDGFMNAMLYSAGGPSFFNDCMTYKEGIWQSENATKVFDIIGKLATYVEPTTVANANNENYKKNQQLILDNKALFMPNGTWVSGEMADAPRAEGFAWATTGLPALAEGGDKYCYTFFEQMWIPAQAKNADLAKQFLAYMYSDEAAAIFAKQSAIQPIKGMSEKLEGENKDFFSVYNDGTKACMGGFAATDPVEGVNMGDTLLGTISSIVSGDKTVDQWKEDVTAASDKLRAALK